MMINSGGRTGIQVESADLRIFRTVAHEGSITKAAARLGYVQSNVTARVQQLESELGTVLFLRNNRGVTLSASGKKLLAYADKIVGLLDEAAKALTAVDEPGGPLLIGSTQTAAAVRMPKLLASYNRQYPNVLLSLTTGHTQFLMEKVLQYELDGAFIGGPCEHPELQAAPAFDEQLVLASAPGVALLEEAVAKPLLVYSRGCSYRDILEKWLQSMNRAQPVVMEFGILEAIIGGVSAGLGVSLLPMSVVRKHAAEGMLRIHEIPEPYSRMSTTFIIRKDTFVSSSLRTFMETLAVHRGEAAAG